MTIDAATYDQLTTAAETAGDRALSGRLKIAKAYGTVPSASDVEALSVIAGVSEPALQHSGPIPGQGESGAPTNVHGYRQWPFMYENGRTPTGDYDRDQHLVELLVRRDLEAAGSYEPSGSPQPAEPGTRTIILE